MATKNHYKMASGLVVCVRSNRDPYDAHKPNRWTFCPYCGKRLPSVIAPLNPFAKGGECKWEEVGPAAFICRVHGHTKDGAA